MRITRKSPFLHEQWDAYAAVDSSTLFSDATRCSMIGYAIVVPSSMPSDVLSLGAGGEPTKKSTASGFGFGAGVAVTAIAVSMFLM